jgi:hypothetical protein
MAVRMPSSLGRASSQDDALDLLGHEILAEKASSLGRAGQRVEVALARLREHGDGEQRPVLLKAAAAVVHAYFIQRELCGLRRHDDPIREYAIPKAVLARLGAA